MPRKTEETLGLVSSFAVLVCLIQGYDGIGVFFALILILLFLFRLTLGKERIRSRK